jgi:hypothetical protein
MAHQKEMGSGLNVLKRNSKRCSSLPYQQPAGQTRQILLPPDDQKMQKYHLTSTIKHLTMKMRPII